MKYGLRYYPTDPTPTRRVLLYTFAAIAVIILAGAGIWAMARKIPPAVQADPPPTNVQATQPLR